MSKRTAYRVGDAVRHRRFGPGEVTATRDGTIVVKFGTQERIFVPEIAPLTKMGQGGQGGEEGGVHVYGTSPIKRTRRTRTEIEALDEALTEIVEMFRPVTVRQVFYQAVNRALSYPRARPRVIGLCSGA